MSENNLNNQGGLKKALTPIGLWAIAVGLVVSGDYYGFAYGFAEGGPVSFLVSFIPVTLMYVPFLFCYTELATSIPHAGGPSAYARRAMGPFAGFITGFSVLIAFLISPCAVALATGALVNYLVPAIPALAATVVFFIFFMLINLTGIETSSKLELVVTIVSLVGLVVFAVLAIPHFEMDTFVGGGKPFTNGFMGVAGAMTFSMWFYFAIDGAAMNAEEMKDPRDIPKGYIPAVATLFITSLIAILLPAGIADYNAIASVDYPLAIALETPYGVESIWPKLIAAIALFAMVASFSAIILSFSRQTYAMGRTGYLPSVFAKTNSKGCPTVGLIVPGTIALIVTVLTNDTGLMVTISVFAALIMYVLAIVSTFIMRKKEPTLERPFSAGKIMPVLALIFVIVLFACVLWANISVLIWVIVVYAVAVIYYLAYGKKNIRPIEEEFNLD